MKKALVGLAVVLVVGGGIWALMNYPPSPTGKATGSAVKPRQGDALQKALWSELSKYEDDYLGAYAEYFENSPDEPLELVNAFNELAYNITGPGGLWRKTVPDKYFGCAANDHMPICKKFKETQQTFSKWDKLQEEMLDIGDNRTARKFLKKNQKDLETYLKDFVPEDESFSAVQATPFFSNNLASAM